jgi:hypothetical protein
LNAASQPLILLLAGWSSGISIYLTTALLGICGRAGWIELPGELKVLSNLLIIIIAVLIFLVEFVADKVPFVDSAWDSVHTFIRPLGAVGMGYMAGSDHGVIIQTLYALLTGTFALNMHAFKASSRLAINTSPEPFSNIAASTTENASVFFMFWLFIKHPIIASALIIAILVLSFLFLRMLWKFVMKLFKRTPAAPTPITTDNKS